MPPVPYKHCVHGEWMSMEEAARRLGVSYESLCAWRISHKDAEGRPALLEVAWDHYIDVNRGRIPRIPGRPPKKQRVRGRLLTVREAAEAAGLPYWQVRQYMYRYGYSLARAVKAIEERKKKAAEQEIMRIIFGRKA